MENEPSEDVSISVDQPPLSNETRRSQMACVASSAKKKLKNGEDGQQSGVRITRSQLRRIQESAPYATTPIAVTGREEKVGHNNRQKQRQMKTRS